jgi:hypothetical protein
VGSSLVRSLALLIIGQHYEAARAGRCSCTNASKSRSGLRFRSAHGWRKWFAQVCGTEMRSCLVFSVNSYNVLRGISEQRRLIVQNLQLQLFCPCLNASPNGSKFCNLCLASKRVCKKKGYDWPSGIAQSVQRLATGWTTQGSKFESRDGAKFFSSPRHPDRFWVPSSLLSNRYRTLFP